MLAQVESKLGINITYVDVNSAAFQQYQRYFQGNGIPYTVLLGPGGKAVQSWSGAHEQGAFQKELQQLMR